MNGIVHHISLSKTDYKNVINSFWKILQYYHKSAPFTAERSILTPQKRLVSLHCVDNNKVNIIYLVIHLALSVPGFNDRPFFSGADDKLSRIGYGGGLGNPIGRFRAGRTSSGHFFSVWTFMRSLRQKISKSCWPVWRILYIFFEIVLSAVVFFHPSKNIFLLFLFKSRKKNVFTLADLFRNLVWINKIRVHV